MRKGFLVLNALFLFLSGLVQAQASAFRVTGYFRGNIVSDLDKIDFSKITHLNIAFINPDVSGNFATVNGLSRLVAAAHLNGVKVLVALGGGSAPVYYSSLINPGNRSGFIINIRKLLADYNVDGIDVDLEGSLITSDYEGFIGALAFSIKPDKLLTGAVATSYASSITIAALAHFDYMTVMSYDKTGPWNPSKPGPHSTYSMAVNDLSFWNINMSVPKERINLGLPFYGYGFNGAVSNDMTYRRIVNSYPGAENFDEVEMNEGGIMYYNGIPTIKNKTKLAKQEAGGVSIWQLLQDTTGSKSLLAAINDELILQ